MTGGHRPARRWFLSGVLLFTHTRQIEAIHSENQIAKIETQIDDLHADDRIAEIKRRVAPTLERLKARIVELGG